jgi:hypothetical protein
MRHYPLSITQLQAQTVAEREALRPLTLAERHARLERCEGFLALEREIQRGAKFRSSAGLAHRIVLTKPEFSEATWRAVAAEISPRLKEDEEAIFRRELYEVIFNWACVEAIQNTLGNFEEHRSRLDRIARTADYLLKLLDKEELFLLDHRRERETDKQLTNIIRREKTLSEELVEIAVNARFLADNAEELRQRRSDPPLRQRNMSVERMMLWPGLAALWVQSGRKVGTGERGPFQNFIFAAHKAYGRTPPNMGTLRTFLRTFFEWETHLQKS